MESSILRVPAMVALLASLTNLSSAVIPRDDAGDASALFRDEIVDAPLRIRWKESSLSDETRFAVAASGLSWRAAWDDQPLIESTKGKEPAYAIGTGRLRSFLEAKQQRANKIAFAFALSLLLDPPDDDATAWRTAHDYLRVYGADLDKALIGVLTAPDKLPLLNDYRQAAADVLVYRAAPRLMPIFFGMAASDDRYLRSRAVAGLGLTAFRTETGLAESVKGFLPEPKELGISAVQMAMIDDVVRKAAEDRDYRVRSAAALALGLIGGEESQALLQKLLKDRAYIQSVSGDKRSVVVSFPVRAQAARSLERWGQMGIEDGSGVYEAKAVGKVVRGAQNITNDAREAKKKVQHAIRFHDGDW